jgi:hypothetical protein
VTVILTTWEAEIGRVTVLAWAKFARSHLNGKKLVIMAVTCHLSCGLKHILEKQ